MFGMDSHYKREIMAESIKELDFPYNLPIWRNTFESTAPDGKLTARILKTNEVSMGNPTIGTLELSNGFELAGCNPSFIWSDDSKYLVFFAGSA